MKSVNYSFNSSARANFVLLWRLKMEEGGQAAQRGARPDHAGLCGRQITRYTQPSAR